MKDQDFFTGQIPEEKALGVLKNTDNDIFDFNINVMDKTLTRGGLLVMGRLVYDPLGLLSPFTLKGRIITPELCEDNFQWDHLITENIKR